MAKESSRRDFLKTSVAVTVGTALGAGCQPRSEKAENKPSPTEKERKACPPCETQVPARPAPKSTGTVRATTYTPWKLEDPASVFFAPVKDRSPIPVWAQKVGELFMKLDPRSVLRKDALVAIKQHFGEHGNKGHIPPGVTKRVVDEVKKLGGKPCLVETNTLYKGSRANTYDHMLTASEHGFSLARLGAPVMILDGVNGQNQQAIAIPGKHFKVVFVASDCFFFDSLVALNHVKGHKMSGFGGAIKNLAMGLSSRAGKLAQHANFKPFIDGKKCTNCGTCAVWCPTGALFMRSNKLQFDSKACIGCGQCLTVCPEGAIENKSTKPGHSIFMEKMAEYALGAAASFGGKALYINVVRHVSELCDCARGKNPIVAPDVGVLASRDPVALDTATLDLCVKAWGKDPFRKLYPEVDYRVTLKHCAKLGLGTLRYKIERA